MEDYGLWTDGIPEIEEVQHMATRSIIAVSSTVSKTESIYCHWDGYPKA